VIRRLELPPWVMPTWKEDLPPEEMKRLRGEYDSMVESGCMLLDELKHQESHLRKMLDESWNDIRFGFSHGDLWFRDILCAPDGRICVLDWEWATMKRPMGLDLFHLGVSTLLWTLGVSFAEAMTVLLEGRGDVETLFRKAICQQWMRLGYKAATRRASVLGYLVYLQNRVRLQYPRTRTLPTEYLETVRALCTATADREYLNPLLADA